MLQLARVARTCAVVALAGCVGGTITFRPPMGLTGLPDAANGLRRDNCVFSDRSMSCHAWNAVAATRAGAGACVHVDAAASLRREHRARGSLYFGAAVPPAVFREVCLIDTGEYASRAADVNFWAGAHAHPCCSKRTRNTSGWAVLTGRPREGEGVRVALRFIGTETW